MGQAGAGAKAPREGFDWWYPMSGRIVHDADGHPHVEGCALAHDHDGPCDNRGFHRAPGTTGLYLRDDNAQIWADTYQPVWHGRLPDGTERLFYTYAAAEQWIASHDAQDIER